MNTVNNTDFNQKLVETKTELKESEYWTYIHQTQTHLCLLDKTMKLKKKKHYWYIAIQILLVLFAKLVRSSKVSANSKILALSLVLQSYMIKMYSLK